MLELVRWITREGVAHQSALNPLPAVVAFVVRSTCSTHLVVTSRRPSSDTQSLRNRAEQSRAMPLARIRTNTTSIISPFSYRNKMGTEILVLQSTRPFDHWDYGQTVSVSASLATDRPCVWRYQSSGIECSGLSEHINRWAYSTWMMKNSDPQ